MSKVKTYTHGTNLSTADSAYNLSPLHRYWDTHSTHDKNRDVGVGFINPSDSSRNVSFAITRLVRGVHTCLIKSSLMSSEYRPSRLSLLTFILRMINPERVLPTFSLLRTLKVREKIAKLACKSSPSNLRCLTATSLERVAVRVF